MRNLTFRLACLLCIWMLGCSKDKDLPSPPLTNKIEPLLRDVFACYDKGSQWNYENERDSTDIAILTLDEVVVRWDTVGKGATGECAYPECRYQERSVYYALKFSPTFTMNVNVMQPFNELPSAILVDPTTRQMNQQLSVITNDKGVKSLKYTPLINAGSFSRVDELEVHQKVYKNVYRLTQYTATGTIEAFWAEGEGIIKYTLSNRKTYELVSSLLNKR